MYKNSWRVLNNIVCIKIMRNSFCQALSGIFSQKSGSSISGIFLALKVSYKIISKCPPSTPLSKSFLKHHKIIPICKLFQFMFWERNFISLGHV